jgi:molecular chaperone GrpE (heat shock protein)
MLEERRKLRYIDTTPLTNITPEMAEEMSKFAEQMLPMVDDLIRDIETISDSKEEKQQQ